MSLLLACCLWVLAGAGVAMLPMRYQYIPGLALMLAAPVLIWMIGQHVGVWAAAFCTLAFLSMFRNPLRYFARKAIGLPVEGPK